MIEDDLQMEIKDIIDRYFEISDLHIGFDSDSCSEEIIELLNEHNILKDE